MVASFEREIRKPTIFWHSSLLVANSDNVSVFSLSEIETLRYKIGRMSFCMEEDTRLNSKTSFLGRLEHIIAHASGDNFS